METESQRLNTGSQRILALAGPVSILVFFIGFWPFARFVPPLHEASDAAEIAGFFRQHSVGFRLNAICILFSCGFLGAFYAEISVQLKRIEGAFSPMTYAQLLTGALAIVPFIPAAVVWTVAAYRPERGDDLIYLMSDFGWVMLIMVGAPSMIQLVMIGIAVLGDDRAEPILPRWYGYFCFSSALLLDGPAPLLAFFKSGPFCWNGQITFWVPVSFFGIWTFVTAFVLLKTITAQARAGAVKTGQQRK